MNNKIIIGKPYRFVTNSTRFASYELNQFNNCVVRPKEEVTGLDYAPEFACEVLSGKHKGQIIWIDKDELQELSPEDKVKYL